MRYRATFVAGLAAGFVLGARAGRERYEQMKKLARRAADNPAVQQAAGAATAQAAGLAKTARSKVTDQVQQRTSGLAGAARQKAGELQGRVPGWRGGGSAVADGGDVPAPGAAADGTEARGPGAVPGGSGTLDGPAPDAGGTAGGTDATSSAQATGGSPAS
jgi:hypothetical protein